MIASIGGLQSERIPLVVTTRPDSLVQLDGAADTLRYDAPGGGIDTLHAQLVRDSAGRSVPVPSYLVRFRIVVPDSLAARTDTAHVVLVNDLRRPSTADTTDAQGKASRVVLFSDLALERHNQPDSVVVEVSAAAPNATPLRGSPFRYTVHIRLRATQP